MKGDKRLLLAAAFSLVARLIAVFWGSLMAPTGLLMEAETTFIISMFVKD